MPNPAEICTIKANGQSYDIWETVEVHRSALEPIINHALMTVSEISTGGKALSDLKLAPGDKVEILLAGISVMNGLVYLRQAAYDERSHAVQIGVASSSEVVTRSTVDVNPGSYPNQTIQQIGSACFGKVGIGFKVVGSPSGADIKFKRACEQLGESRFNFIERLGRLVNLHLIDDGKGGIEAYRGPQGSGGILKEGVNILRARLLLKINEYTPNLKGVSQAANQDSGPASAQISADAEVPVPFGGSIPGNYKFGAEDATTKEMLQHRVDHQANHIAAETVDGVITVQGWFRSDGDLWFTHVRDPVTVDSPMLIPEGKMDFVIKEIVHRQSSQEGTTTDIMITNPLGLGAPTVPGVTNPAG